MRHLISALAVLALTACAAANAPTTTATKLLEGSKISVLFQDFPEGTVCTVATPSETLSTTAIPGQIDYQALYASSPVTCHAPDGGVYDVDVASVVPNSFRVAGLTAYGTGIIVSTVSSGTLTQYRNDNGVVKRP